MLEQGTSARRWGAAVSRRGTGWARVALPCAIALFLFAFTAWVHLAELGAALEWDNHVFIVVAMQLKRGLLPYRDLWELKPPAMFYYLAAIFALWRDALWGVRLVDFVLYLGAGGAFYRLCRREASWPLAVIGTAAWLFVSHHFSFNLGGLYTEEYAAMAGIGAVAAAAAWAASGRCGWALLSGLAVATAALFKHPGAAALVPAAIVMTRRPVLRAYVLLLLGAIVPVLLVMAYFWSQGALEEFLECNLWALVVHGRLGTVNQGLLLQRLQALILQGQTLLAPFPLLLGSLLLGIPVALLRPTLLRVATLLWVLLDYVGVAAQRQFAQHHFILTFPSTCLLGTLAAAWLLQPRPRERRLLSLARLALGAVACWFAVPAAQVMWQQRLPVVRAQWRRLLSGPAAWPQSPARDFEARIGAYVRERTAPTDRIHVQGYGATLLGVYETADRRVASRYFYEAPYPIDPARVLADLRRSQPAYIVVASHPPFLFLTPWLMQEYSLETVKWLNYRNDIWVRTQHDIFAAGTAVGLASRPELGALALAAPAGGAAAPLEGPRRGQWTSPVLPVWSDDGKVFVDWNPRADLAWNRAGQGFAEVDATFTDLMNDPRALLGAATRKGTWSAWPRRDAQAVTVRFGFQAVIDEVMLVPNEVRTAAGCPPALIYRAPEESGNRAAAVFEPIDGTWERLSDGAQRFRFLASPAAAVRVQVTAGTCGTEGGLRRIRAYPAGMGITVRYRTGPEPQLDARPWTPIDDGDELRWVRADRYVQVQYELWSASPELTPVLRVAHVGRVRFELAQAPPQSARQMGTREQTSDGTPG